MCVSGRNHIVYVPFSSYFVSGGDKLTHLVGKKNQKSTHAVGSVVGLKGPGERQLGAPQR